jgi:hypothetical protein
MVSLLDFRRLAGRSPLEIDLIANAGACQSMLWIFAATFKRANRPSGNFEHRALS